MKYTAKVEEYATESPSYIRTIVFAANDMEQLETLLDKYADYGLGEGIEVDDSLMPKRFNESGGFASKLISFTDETGKDFSSIWNM